MREEVTYLLAASPRILFLARYVQCAENLVKKKEKREAIFFEAKPIVHNQE